MSLFVYITPECRENAQHHSLSDELERFKDRIESSQSTSHFNPFPPPYLVKKKLGGRQGRLIADLRRRGDHAVVVFLAVMMRGDKAYENHFATDPVTYGKQHFANLVSDEQLAEYIEKRLQVAPPPLKPDPSAEEYGFLYQAFAHRHAVAEEYMVYETSEWKDTVSEERIAQQLVRFAQPCVDALSKEPGIHLIDVPGKHGWGIWIHRSEGRLLLIIPVTGDTQEAATKTVDQYRAQLETGSLNDILRASRRAYPAYMLTDEDTWVEIEKEPVANMALSPEESEVLLSARSQDGAFPLFINGRAGSGKSTILQYLFADLLFYYLTTPAASKIAPPVYLTANGELLSVARSFVKRILRNEASLRGDADRGLVDGNSEILDEAFQEFQPCLLAMVDARTRRERFNLANRVDYSRFRKLWMDWFGMDREAVREFGPDLSWHVIRSYIKGMSSESLLDPDDYVQLPENQITVTRDTFEKVYERVWEGRYSNLSEAENLWDDQDLARFIVDGDLVKPTHPAVLCDEAQDFTRIELELLLRLNLFSNRAVPPHDLSRVPFAFAGDQFQTLNPTGFRWDSIKASFVEKFIHALDPAGRSGRADLNYQELRYNYRSTAPIVRFSNGIQALRAVLFQMPELRPQTPWATSKRAFPVSWFHSNNGAFWKKFKEVGSFVVIVPCNEGEEAEYVSHDPFLKENVRVEDNIPQNVLSAARAKGREYPGVVVYGFGETAPKGLMELVEAGRDRDTHHDQSLPSQYFINRLYVAASRPKHRLIIVDTEKGIQGLWNFANNEESSRQLLDAANRGRTVWTVDPEDDQASVVEGMTMGKAEDLSRESAGDPLENAKAFEQDGRSRRDSFLLRQASLAYRSAGNAAKAAECRARAQELDGTFVEAAQSFTAAGLLIPEAVRCYWKAGKIGWSHIIEAGKNDAAVSRETEFKWARALMEQQNSVDGLLQLLDEIKERLAEPEFGAYAVKEQVWRDAIDDRVRSVTGQASEVEARSLAAVLESLEASGVILPAATVAEVYSRAGDLRKAIDCWDKAGETKSDAYLRAKAAIEPYPEKLTALGRTGLIDEALREFETHRAVPLDAGQWGVVAAAYLQRGRFDEALEAGWNAKEPSLLRQVALKALVGNESQPALRALEGSIMMMVQKQDWKPLAKFAASLDFSPDPTWTGKGPLALVKSHAEHLQGALVRALARSDAFAEMPGHLQRQFSDFFRRFLRVKEGHWRGHLSVQEAGSAIERGGRFTDAIAYYEAILTEPTFSPEEKLFARQRWIVGKSRQVFYERAQKGKGKSRKVSELQQELARAISESGLKRLSELPEFPMLDPISVPTGVAKPPWQGNLDSARPTTAKPKQDIQIESTPVVPITNISLSDRVNAIMGEISIDLSRKIGRCNFSHQATMETASANLRQKTMSGDLEWTRRSEDEWFSEVWRLAVSITDDLLLISSERDGATVSFQLPPASPTE